VHYKRHTALKSATILKCCKERIIMNAHCVLCRLASLQQLLHIVTSGDSNQNSPVNIRFASSNTREGQSSANSQWHVRFMYLVQITYKNVIFCQYYLFTLDHEKYEEEDYVKINEDKSGNARMPSNSLCFFIQLH
jgi:hypothetical protein